MRPLLLLLSIVVVPPAVAHAESTALTADDECLADGCALSALQHRSTKLLAEENSTSSQLSIYQWNPHWQCFYKGKNPACQREAKRVLNSGLRSLNVDFANIIELVDYSYRPPPGYAMIRSTCNDMENALLIYAVSKWKPSPKSGARVSGCILHKDRAFNVQAFESVGGSPLSQVVVVGAHYPHHINVPRLKSAIQRVLHATTEKRVIFIGDTNQERGDSRDVARLLDMPGALQVRSSPMYVSCCNKIHQGFVWKFDRIITNVGKVTHSRLFGVPRFAAVSMHKAVHATIQLD